MASIQERVRQLKDENDDMLDDERFVTPRHFLA
jgi:hypothetical protein